MLLEKSEARKWRREDKEVVGQTFSTPSPSSLGELRFELSCHDSAMSIMIHNSFASFSPGFFFFGFSWDRLQKNISWCNRKKSERFSRSRAEFSRYFTEKKLVSFCFFEVFLLLSLLVGFWGGKSLKGRRKEIKTCFALMYSNAPVLRQVTSMADLNTKGRETSRATSSSCAADSSREG